MPTTTLCEAGFDGRFIGTGTGLSRYSSELLAALLAQDEPRVRWTVLVRDRDAWPHVPTPHRVVVADVAHYSIGEQVRLPRLIRRLGLDVGRDPHRYRGPVLRRDRTQRPRRPCPDRCHPVRRDRPRDTGAPRPLTLVLGLSRAVPVRVAVIDGPPRLVVDLLETRVPAATAADPSQPLALRYHGHQFRVYNPDLGDGRGFLAAQMRDRSGRLLDLATKGSGTTPWSRGDDGRLTLKGGVREVLSCAGIDPNER